MMRQYLESALAAIGKRKFDQMHCRRPAPQAGSDRPANLLRRQRIFERIGSNENTHDVN
ncbi:MAG: hypothetical protein H6575_17030 [Lewinellaceae bacterium]|nr:hypothetical protein [Lewinellaceae bacterium]